MPVLLSVNFFVRFALSNVRLKRVFFYLLEEVVPGRVAYLDSESLPNTVIRLGDATY